MKISAVIESVKPDFDIAWGDTVRIRDIYTPFFDLMVHISDRDRNRMPKLRKILLYSFRMYYANVHDEFDEQACFRGTQFGRIEPGMTIEVVGPVHPILPEHTSMRFGEYDFVILQTEMHSREYDINGDLNGAVTEWLVEEKSINEKNIPSGVNRLVVAWECARILDT